MLQGFHVLADTYDGFGGFAASLLDDVADDYANKSVFTFSLTPTSFANNVRAFFTFHNLGLKLIFFRVLCVMEL